MTQIYRRTLQLRFREADPAGIMYFANIFSLAHDTFEDFIQAAGLDWKEWFKEPQVIVPIRHTECDFRSPFRPGETYEIQATVAQFRETSLQMQYVFLQGSRVHAVVKMVHAFLDPRTKQKTPIPENIKKHLLPYLSATPGEAS